MAIEKVNLSSPWVSYYREIEAMFWSDPEVHVVFDEDKPAVKLFVDNGKKAAALTKLMKHEQQFGNVKLTIDIIPANADLVKQPEDIDDIICSAFKYNPAFCYCKQASLGPYMIYYVVFKNCVVQYFNDDLSDAHGLCSTLYQTIAKDIFIELSNTYYCTNVPESPMVNTVQFGLPLGEWP